MNKKWLRLGLITTSALAVLAACSNGDSNGGSSTGDDDGDAVNFSVTTVRWADWGDDFLDGFIAETEEEANVNIEWDIYLDSEWGDQKAVLMGGGDLPDAFLGSIAINDADMAQFPGTFIPLEDLIEENMPNLVAAMEDDPSLRALVTSPDEHIYSLPTKLPMRPLTGNQMYINQAWLDNLGLDMPDTYEDFIDVLRAFRDEDANGNGDENDEIPFGGGFADPVLSFTLPFGTAMSPSNWFTLDDGELVYIPTSEGYRDGVAWMHEAYSEGLIDEELFTQDGTLADAKRQDESDALVGVSVGWTPDVLFAGHADEYVPLYPLAGPDGERYVHADSSHYSRNELTITAGAEDPAAILRWADQFYTEDASIQTFYGSFGVATEKNEDGTYEVLPAPDGDTDTFAWVNSLRDFGPKYVSDGFNDKVNIDENSGDGLKLSLDEEVNQYVRDPFPDVMFTQEELNRISILGVDIGSYITATQARWVTDGGAEEEWDEYMETLNQMGFEEYIGIHHDAYDRFLESQ